MFSTVIGSYPFELKKPTSTKDRILDFFNSYDPYKLAIETSVISQLKAGVDVISDGQVRGDMVSAFTKFIPGMKFEMNSTVIFSKIKPPITEITVNDLKFVNSILNNYFKGEVPEIKGIKGIITGPSTIIHSSRIESFYKNKNQAIIDLAYSLRYEVEAIVKKVKPKYIQFDEPFLSTGMVDLKVAKEAIDILSKDINIPIAMHVCGNISNVFKDLSKFNVDILDLEFAGNNVNINVLKENIGLVKNKKIGFGCLDTSLNSLDSREDVFNLVKKGIDLLGYENIILGPDCGLRKTNIDVAFNKLKLMNEIKDELNKR